MPVPAEDIDLWIKVPVHQAGWPREHHHAINSEKHCRNCAAPLEKRGSITLDWDSRGNPEDIDRFCTAKCTVEHITTIATGDEPEHPAGPMALPEWVWEYGEDA